MNIVTLEREIDRLVSKIGPRPSNRESIEDKIHTLAVYLETAEQRRKVLEVGMRKWIAIALEKGIKVAVVRDRLSELLTGEYNKSVLAELIKFLEDEHKEREK